MRKTRYHIEDTLFGFCVKDRVMGYDFEVDLSEATEFRACLLIQNPQSNKKVIVTGRDFDEYPVININPENQYIEIGAGLGGFVPWMVANHKMKHKPIVIEQLNYDAAEVLLHIGRDVAQHKGYDKNLLDRIEKFIQRADTYTYSNDINLITLPLGWALNTFPQLKGSADVVIDHLASTYYTQVEFPLSYKDFNARRHIYDMRISLLKPNGIIVE